MDISDKYLLDPSWMWTNYKPKRLTKTKQQSIKSKLTDIGNNKDILRFYRCNIKDDNRDFAKLTNKQLGSLRGGFKNWLNKTIKTDANLQHFLSKYDAFVGKEAKQLNNLKANALAAINDVDGFTEWLNERKHLTSKDQQINYINGLQLSDISKLQKLWKQQKANFVQNLQIQRMDPVDRFIYEIFPLDDYNVKPSDIVNLEFPTWKHDMVDNMFKAFNEFKANDRFLLGKLDEFTEEQRDFYARTMPNFLKMILRKIAVDDKCIVNIYFTDGSSEMLTLTTANLNNIINVLGNINTAFEEFNDYDPKHYDKILKSGKVVCKIEIRKVKAGDTITNTNAEVQQAIADVDNAKDNLMKLSQEELVAMVMAAQKDNIIANNQIERQRATIKKQGKQIAAHRKYQQRKNKEGKFWVYANTSLVNLHRYGILNDYDFAKRNYEVIMDVFNNNCLVYALMQSGICTDDEIAEVKHRLLGDSVKQVDIVEIADAIKVNIEITYHDFNKDTCEIANSSKVTMCGTKRYNRLVRLLLINNHYMLKETNVVFTCLGKDVGKTTKPISVVEMLKLLFRTQRFRKITMDKLLDYRSCRLQALPIENTDYTTLYYNDKYCCEKLARKQTKNKQKGYTKIYFADFETVTNTRVHTSFMLCYVDADNENIQTLYGKDCAEIFLEDLVDGCVVYFHNLKYDINFVINKLTSVNKIVERSNSTMIISGLYGTKKITFKDSYAIIPMKLSGFTNCFALGNDYEKEVFPYKYYNSVTLSRIINAKHKEITEVYGDVDAANECFDDDTTRKQFTENLNRLHCVDVDDGKFAMLSYAQYYCERDVKVLKAGFLKFRQMLLDNFAIDACDFLSISSIAAELMAIRCYNNNDNLYKFAGKPREFISRCIYGGRCMLGDNEKRIMDNANTPIVDFDAVSLYPSAIARLYLIEGKPIVLENWQLNDDYLRKHLFDDNQREPTDNKFISAFYVEVEITNTPKHLHFPLLTRNKLDPENFALNDNDIRHMYVDHIMYEDLIKFQGCTLKPLRGYYFNGNRDYSVQDVIKNLFELRARYKKEGNPLQNVIKLLLNSIYGKSILKPMDRDVKIKSSSEIDGFVNKEYNFIETIRNIPGTSLYKIRAQKSILKHYNFCTFGVSVLSMSKRIINEVFSLCEANGFSMFYQDTDSVHMYEKDLTDLAQIYQQTYGRMLIGKQLGQFHSDFAEITNGHTSKSIMSVFCGKKCYMDVLTNDLGQIAVHARMKGIPQRTIEITANKLYKDCCKVYYKNGIFNVVGTFKELTEISIVRLYKDLYCGETITFNLLDGNARFKQNDDFTISTVDKFERSVKFT